MGQNTVQRWHGDLKNCAWIDIADHPCSGRPQYDTTEKSIQTFEHR